MPRPDPFSFDPVRFPGLAPGEVWPPDAFDFSAPWLRHPDLAFERGASGEVVLVRRCEAMRLVLDIETAHSALDVTPKSRDFRLLRLVPSALCLVETVAPGDPVPPSLQGLPPPPPEEHHVYAATTSLVAALQRGAGPAGGAFLDALRRTPPGVGMFEAAAAQCIRQSGFGLERIANLARGLQRLAHAHAEVLAADAMRPDFAGMERMVAATARAMTHDTGWSRDLLAHGLRQIAPIIGRPRKATEELRDAAAALLEAGGTLGDAARLAHAQGLYRDRLIEMGIFWRRLAAAWASVHPKLTDRQEIDLLCRNALRRLSLKDLYAPI